MLDKNKLNQQQAIGRKYFSLNNLSGADLSGADLENTFLSRVNLKQANLNSANLKNADLSDADLTESSLIKANLNKAHLTGINLSKANLTQANFSESILTQANFTEACLANASLTSSVLIEANLSEADLSGTDLSRTDLSTVNLQNAFYDDETKFPANFDPLHQEMFYKYGTEKLLAQFNHLYQCSNKYLGNVMTTRYFAASRPDSDWLEQFKLIDHQIVFQGNTAAPIRFQQLQLFQQWKKKFIKSCSSIIKDFPILIKA